MKLREQNIKKRDPKDWREVAVYVYNKTVKYEKSYKSDLKNLKILLNGSNGLAIIGSVSQFSPFSLFIIT